MIKMTVDSPVLGSLEIEPGDIYSFPNGIPGFEEERRFVIVKPDAGSPFAYFQSVDRSSLVFLVADPFTFFPSYDFEIAEQVKDELAIRTREDVGVWCIVTVPERMEDATANLLAPIILNVTERKGRQMILAEVPYLTKHALFADVASVTQESGGEDVAGAHTKKR